VAIAAFVRAALRRGEGLPLVAPDHQLVLLRRRDHG
jgi:hypothetical protein